MGSVSFLVSFFAAEEIFLLFAIHQMHLHRGRLHLLLLLAAAATLLVAFTFCCSFGREYIPRSHPPPNREKLKKTCIYDSEKNCVRVCLFYILNKEVQRKVTVEIRKIIDSNNNCQGLSLVDAHALCLYWVGVLRPSGHPGGLERLLHSNGALG